ncbi:phospholipase D family protein [Hymenobacter edaphi]|uniref:phospholipase D family protein n=1 Tax=Hymenobacter edaphi TaxID=2211146 RepID=UPI001057CF5B|nr:phospholipase D family protein [Hymenobacter edaphi]
MSRFVTGKELEEVVCDILFQAKRQLLLMSPYIKLDDYFRNILDKHAHNPDLEILVVFGKNEGNITRSVSLADLEYFTKFPRITLVYVPNLHAKYYANESKGVVTSINLYDYSFRNNIEFGVYSETIPLMEKLLDSVNRKSVDNQAFEYAVQVAFNHDVVFAKRPTYKQRTGMVSKLLGGKDYLEPTVVFNALDALLHNRPYESRRLAQFPKEIEFSQTLAQVRPSRAEVEAQSLTVATPTRPTSTTRTSDTRGNNTHRNSELEPRSKREYYRATPADGYCIRTGVVIPFNPNRPFCYDAYRRWAEFENEDYPERFCHLSGRPSHGRTSKRAPILTD